MKSNTHVALLTESPFVKRLEVTCENNICHVTALNMFNVVLGLISPETNRKNAIVVGVVAGEDVRHLMDIGIERDTVAVVVVDDGSIVRLFTVSEVGNVGQSVVFKKDGIGTIGSVGIKNDELYMLHRPSDNVLRNREVTKFVDAVEDE